MNSSLLSMSKSALAAVLLAGLVGCANKKPDPLDSVSGVIVKPDHVKLSPAAVAHVRLADVTKGYVKSDTVVEKKIRLSDDGTIPFTLAFKESQIDKSRRYAVDARIVDRNQVYVIGGKRHPVLTKGHGDTVEMQLDQASKF
ncbi:MAG TPA: YbaY family lipoprotein [Tepidisphaeraceae bacterium]|nr:YbaY family lipoprotein [Tepidisphaeraceae bacterium]